MADGSLCPGLITQQQHRSASAVARGPPPSIHSQWYFWVKTTVPDLGARIRSEEAGGEWHKKNKTTKEDREREERRLTLSPCISRPRMCSANTYATGFTPWLMPPLPGCLNAETLTGGYTTRPPLLRKVLGLSSRGRTELHTKLHRNCLLPPPPVPLIPIVKSFFFSSPPPALPA